MTEIYDNKFHRQYVGGVGAVVEKEAPDLPIGQIQGQSYEEVLAEYRWYVRDPEAELPEEVVEQLVLLGKIHDARKA